MRLSKQIGQIFPLSNEFDNDESDSVGVAVDECLGPSNKIVVILFRTYCSFLDKNQ